MNIHSLLARFFILFFSLTAALSAAPTVTNITPSAGPSSGGTSVTITGEGFTGASAVQFGMTAAASFTVDSDTSITGTTSPHSPQAVFVTVTTPSGTSEQTPASYFVYQGDWLAYVTNAGGNFVSVVDTATESEIADVTTGVFPFAVAITLDGTKAYVVNNVTNTVSVIDTARNVVIATITVGTNPRFIVLTPDGTKAYIANGTSNNVSVIDTSIDTPIATVTAGATPYAIAITPNGSEAYVSNYFSNNVTVIDIPTNTVSATVAVGSNPESIAITPDGTKAFVLNTGSNDISVIDTSIHDVIATIPSLAVPSAIAFTPDGASAYVVNNANNSVSVVDTAMLSLTKTIPVGRGPIALAMKIDGTKVYVINTSDSTVSVIDTATNTVVATIPLVMGVAPAAISITPDGGKAFVVNQDTNNLSVIDTATNMVIKTITGTFNSLFSIAITPDQAPLAKFIAITASAGSPTEFDAFSSVSPVGTIANYFWDFGDGSTLNTSTPIASHTYAASNVYTVTLVVTNSAGTSTETIFSNSTYSFNEVQGDPLPVKHGGPSAISAQSIFIPAKPSPPSGLHVRRVKNQFATQSDLINILTWKAPLDGSTPVAYKIYKDPQLTKLLATIPADQKLRFKQHQVKKGRIYRYFIVTIDKTGLVSVPATIAVKG